MSQLNLISDESYRKGLEAMKKDAESASYLISDLAFLHLEAVKTG